MFQISVSPKGRSAASSLTVLAAMGASGMVAKEASAAIITHEPNHAIYAQNSSYVSLNWNNWLDDNSWHGVASTAPAMRPAAARMSSRLTGSMTEFSGCRRGATEVSGGLDIPEA